MIIAKIIFKYENRNINPFSSYGNISPKTDKILLRDIEKEHTILNILEKAEFKVRSDYIYIEQEEHIVDFVFKIIPLLQEHSVIYYSESFKKLASRQKLKFSGALRLNTLTDILEFSFNIDGLDKDELESLLESIKLRKKYYRLKDGTFLPLDTNNIMEIAGLLDYLGLEPEDFKDNLAIIPKFRAFYMDQYIKKSNLKYIERNHSFKELVQNVLEPSDMDFAIPSELNAKLRGYQKFGFKWLKTLVVYGIGGILADDMGLGKTIQVITLILSDKKENGSIPSLVVAPTSLVYNWCAEIEKFAPSLNAAAISGSKEERLKLMENISEYDLVITSYPLIRRDIESYMEYKFRYCILDEAQHIKNPDSQNAISVKQLKAENYFALTGTPIENSLMELWSIFDFVMPGYLFSRSQFSKKYEVPIMGDYGQKELQELGKQIHPFILRRLKEDVLPELPEKIESKITVELTEEQKKLYAVYLHKIKLELQKELEEKGFEKSRFKILSALTRLRQICCHPYLFIENYAGESGKMQLLEEIIPGCIDGGHRILLFSQFTGMLQIIRDWLDKEKISYLYFDGSTPAAERGNLVRNFNEGAGSIFLISLKAGGTGLNLTGADTVIHFDPWWNPAVEEQATDRAYRIGQKKAVQVMKLVSKGTIEEKIYNLQEEKRFLADAVIQPGETLLSKMNREDIMALFEF